MKKSKSFVALLLSAMLIFAAGCNEKVAEEPAQPEETNVQAMTAGEYEVSVKGYQDGMKVKVTLDANSIKAIEVL